MGPLLPKEFLDLPPPRRGAHHDQQHGTPGFIPSTTHLGRPGPPQALPAQPPVSPSSTYSIRKAGLALGSLLIPPVMYCIMRPKCSTVRNERKPGDLGNAQAPSPPSPWLGMVSPHPTAAGSWSRHAALRCSLRGFAASASVLFLSSYPSAWKEMAWLPLAARSSGADPGRFPPW